MLNFSDKSLSMTTDLQVDKNIVIMYVIDLMSDLQHQMFLMMIEFYVS